MGCAEPAPHRFSAQTKRRPCGLNGKGGIFMAEIFEEGIDVSRYQGDVNWTAVAASGKRFAILRAVSSNDAGVYVDPTFAFS